MDIRNNGQAYIEKTLENSIRNNFTPTTTLIHVCVQ